MGEMQLSSQDAGVAGRNVRDATATASGMRAHAPAEYPRSNPSTRSLQDRSSESAPLRYQPPAGHDVTPEPADEAGASHGAYDLSYESPELNMVVATPNSPSSAGLESERRSELEGLRLDQEEDEAAGIDTDDDDDEEPPAEEDEDPEEHARMVEELK